jgi:hypothetical protein
MCTVSWATQNDGYLLLFNRDELKTRKPAEGPGERDYSGVHAIAPVDGDQGGTWIMVNEFGLSLGLLNHYTGVYRDEGGDRPSRGNLILACADLERTFQVIGRMVGMDLGRYPPFRLFGLDRSGAVLMTWDGHDLRSATDGSVAPPLTSSSFRSEEVSAFRLEQFRLLDRSERETGEGLEVYHRHHDPSMPAHSVMMCRPDACTHSLCRIDVTRTEARLRYEPQAWFHRDAQAGEIKLALRD